MKRDNFDNKATAGCFALVAILFLAVTIFLHNEEKEKRQNKQEITHPNTSSTDGIHHKKENTAIISTNNIAAPVTTNKEDDDASDDDDPLENPDFDDLIPGDEYDEEFVDRSMGDPELYDEP